MKNIFMKDSLKIINLMDLEELFFVKVIIMKENVKIICAMDKVNMSTQMDKFKKFNIKMVLFFKIELIIIIHFNYY